MFRLIVSVVVLLGVPAVFAADASLPTDGLPVWFEIVGDGMTPGAVCKVRSAASREVIGELKPGTRFLRFGESPEFMTLAYQGQVVFIPAGAATELFPEPSRSTEFRSPGKTLEELAKANKAKLDAIKNGAPLAPSFENQPKGTPGAGGLAVEPTAAGVSSGK